MCDPRDGALLVDGAYVNNLPGRYQTDVQTNRDGCADKQYDKDTIMWMWAFRPYT